MWLFCIASQLALLLAIFWRNHHRRFPAFTTMVAIKCVKSLLLFWVGNGSWSYFWIYWVGGAISIVAVCFVLREIFHIVFSPYPNLPNGTIASLIFTVCLLFTLILLTVDYNDTTNTPISGVSIADRSFFLLLMVDRAAHITLAGALALVILLARFLGLPVRNQSFGISLGLLFYSTVHVFIASAMMHTEFFYLVSHLDRVAWQVALTIWLMYFWRRNIPMLSPSKEMLALVHEAVAALKARQESYRPSEVTL
jgi:hypothetical protein